MDLCRFRCFAHRIAPCHATVILNATLPIAILPTRSRPTGSRCQNVAGAAREYDCRPGTPANFREGTSMQETEMGGYEAQHFRYVASGNVATITLDRPDRKNPLTFEAYDELRDLFRELRDADRRQGGGLHRRGRQFLLGRRRARDHRPAGRDGHAGTAAVHAHDRRSGQGDARVSAADRRRHRRRMHGCGRDDRLRLRPSLGTARSKLAFLFVRVGLAGADMGACTLLPRLIGLSRAADLLYTGRVVDGDEGERIGFYNRLRRPTACSPRRRRWRRVSPTARRSVTR